MPNRHPISLIPKGHIPLTQFIEDVVCRLHGKESVAEIIGTRATGGTFFEMDDGDGKQTLQNADMWITRRGGQEVSYREDTAQWDHVRRIIKDAFANGSLPAIVDGDSIPRDFWKESTAELALVSGTYDVAPDPAHDGKPIFVSQVAAARFIRSLDNDAAPNHVAVPEIDLPPGSGYKMQTTPTSDDICEWVETLKSIAPLNRDSFRSEWARKFPNAPKSMADDEYKKLEPTLKTKPGRPPKLAK